MRKSEKPSPLDALVLRPECATAPTLKQVIVHGKLNVYNTEEVDAYINYLHRKLREAWDAYEKTQEAATEMGWKLNPDRMGR